MRPTPNWLLWFSLVISAGVILFEVFSPVANRAVPWPIKLIIFAGIINAAATLGSRKGQR